MKQGQDTQEQAPSPGRARWVALAMVLVASVMDAIDVTVVNMAIPSLQQELGASYAQIQWITAGYGLAFALGLITGGRLGDLYGRRRVFLAGVAAFTLASLAAGVAAGPGMLIAARVAQGLAAAVMVPQVLATIHVTFTERERGKVFGIYGAVMALGTVSGPLIGALLVEADLFGLGWRPIFLVNLPAGIAALALAVRFLPDSCEAAAQRLDLVGVVWAAAGLLLVMFPLTRGQAAGWPEWCWLMMVAAVPVLAGFVLYQRARRGRSPLVDLALLGRRSFSAGLATQLVFGLVSGLFFLGWTLYLQIGLSWTPLHAGLTGIWLSVGMMLGAGVSMQVLVPRIGRYALLLGTAVGAAGAGGYMAVAAHDGAAIGSGQMVAPLLAMGLGMGLIISPLTDLTLAGVPHASAGSASGLLNTVTQLGNALGIALSSVVFTRGLGGQAEQVGGGNYPHAFAHGLWYVLGAFALMAVLILALPKRAPAPTGQNAQDVGEARQPESPAPAREPQHAR